MVVTRAMVRAQEEPAKPVPPRFDQQIADRKQSKKVKRKAKLKKKHLVVQDSSESEPEFTREEVEGRERKPKQIIEEKRNKGAPGAKRRGPVDEYFEEAEDYEVARDGDELLAATLNQSNVERNNNKFYIVQLLKRKGRQDDFVLFSRWGRIGYKGMNSCSCYDNFRAGLRAFRDKLRDKTEAGDYIQVHIAGEDEALGKEELEARLAADFEKAMIQPTTKNIVRLIFDTKLFEKMMAEVGYDTERMPLGKLSEESLSRGLEILADLAEALSAKKQDRKLINELSSQFYSEIPHDFKFRKMWEFVIDSQDLLREKLSMLQELREIKFATRILDDLPPGCNLYEHNYRQLNCALRPATVEEHAVVARYIQTNKGPTHKDYRLELESLLSVRREEEHSRFMDLGNRKLLFHGSRLTNYVGILSQGLRIAPPEAPVTGYMFGKGIYFADVSTKSANYCGCNRDNPTGILLICQVALGKERTLKSADYNASQLPKGFHSTKGAGRYVPRTKDHEQLGGTTVPVGGCEQQEGEFDLLYNQFIVYDVRQVKLSFIAQMRFVYA